MVVEFLSRRRSNTGLEIGAERAPRDPLRRAPNHPRSPTPRCGTRDTSERSSSSTSQCRMRRARVGFDLIRLGAASRVNDIFFPFVLAWPCLAGPLSSLPRNAASFLSASHPRIMSPDLPRCGVHRLASSRARDAIILSGLTLMGWPLASRRSCVKSRFAKANFDGIATYQAVTLPRRVWMSLWGIAYPHVLTLNHAPPSVLYLDFIAVTLSLYTMRRTAITEFGHKQRHRQRLRCA